MRKSEQLLAKIRNHEELTRGDKATLILQLSVPSILAQISAILMFFIDASMVGHLGAGPSASIGLVETTLWLLGGLTTASAMGFSVQVAHFIGAGDFARARQVLRQAFVCTFIYSLVLMSFGIAIHSRLPFWLGGGADVAADASVYFLIFSCTLPFEQLNNLCGSMLKCSGEMKIPSVLNVMMCVLDVCFNYIFIFVLGMGVKGAAFGTMAAFVITSLMMCYFLVVRNRQLSLWHRNDDSQYSSEYLSSAVKIGAPMALQHVMMSGAQIVSTTIVAPLGNMSIAANSFAVTAESLCYMPGYGIQEAATTLVGQSVGAGQHRLVRSFSLMTVSAGIMVMTMMAVLMYAFAPEMIGLMSPVDEIRRLGSEALRIEAFAEPMFAASIVAYGVFVGAGDTLRPMIINLVSMWGVRLTLAAWLAPRMGLRGVWIAMAIELTFRGLLFLARLLRGRWYKIKTETAGA